MRFGEAYRGSEDDENATGDSRYIYAYARVNPNLLDQPQLDPVPAPFEKPKTEGKKPAEPSQVKEGAKGPEGEKGTKSAPPIAPPGPPPNFIPPSPPPSSPPANLPAAVQDSTSSPQAPSSDSNASSATDEVAQMKADREAEIARIQASNGQKQREFNEKVAKAQNRVKELNENLADWYYVISNEVYEKIRLNRVDFVKAKEKESEEMPEEIKASHILISYQGASRADADIKRSKDAANSEAQRIHKSVISEGKDFAEMAKKHSDGPSGPKGGDLGKFKFEVMAKPFSEAAFALEVGAISEVVETDFGFHIIKRTE